MATEISICNLASANLLSADRVTSINPSDGSTLANLCQTFYPIARDTALTEHNWFFARKTFNASLDGDGVYDGVWAYKYGLPADCLIAREVHPKGYHDPQPFDVESTDTGNILLTDMTLARLTYTYRCTDAPRYPMTFVVAISWLLASFLAGPVMQKNKRLSSEALQKYDYFLAKAKNESNTMSKSNVTQSSKNYRPAYLPQV